MITTHLLHLVVYILHRNLVNVHCRQIGTVLGIVSSQFHQDSCIHQFIDQFIYQSERNAQLVTQSIRCSTVHLLPQNS